MRCADASAQMGPFPSIDRSQAAYTDTTVIGGRSSPWSRAAHQDPARLHPSDPHAVPSGPLAIGSSPTRSESRTIAVRQRRTSGPAVSQSPSSASGNTRSRRSAGGDGASWSSATSASSAPTSRQPAPGPPMFHETSRTTESPHSRTVTFTVGGPCDHVR
jgi:hypothetical protein